MTQPQELLQAHGHAQKARRRCKTHAQKASILECSRQVCHQTKRANSNRLEADVVILAFIGNTYQLKSVPCSNSHGLRHANDDVATFFKIPRQHKGKDETC